MIKKLFLSLLFLTCTSQVFSEVENAKRIHSLLPELGSTFHIEPYIPDDFVLVRPKNGLNDSYWMPNGLYEKYIENLEAEHPPFIQVMVVKGPKNENLLKEYISDIKKHLPT